MTQSPLDEMLALDKALDTELWAFLAQLNYRDAHELKILFTKYPAPVVAFRMAELVQYNIQTHDRSKCTVCP